MIYLGGQPAGQIYVGDTMPWGIYLGDVLHWKRDPDSGSFTDTGAVVVPLWVRWVDVVLLGGGASGQTGSGANASAGDGGNAGAWVTRRFERGVDFNGTPTLSFSVGAGGAQAPNSDKGGPNAGQATTATGIGSGLSAAGGSGTTSGQNGASPGNSTFEGVVYTGGAGGTGNAGSPTAPGAAGAGGNGGFFGSRTRGAAGARGQAWYRFRSWS
ncbi:hypothetical protein L5G28_07850 [Gordonia sp. HY285]|uniref:glycine-rich domain-containing protein n=1 Tax=Gordonia liuliyuniae TaxID=2911517 RepID=UPI001F2003F6|nr:hypothetical protein [Gordonia liuliyuniae]MCF8610075.1 hypothetical protein [Gordonia liuliyuniae]